MEKNSNKMKNNAPANAPAKEFDFKEYKIEATREDFVKLEEATRIKWWEHFPIIGALIYLNRNRYHVIGIDRGPLRKAYYKWVLIMFFSMLIYVFGLVIILTPLLLRWITLKAIKETKEKIKNNDL